MRPQPESKKAPGDYDDNGKSTKKRKRHGQNGSVKEKLLKGNLLILIMLINYWSFLKIVGALIWHCFCFALQFDL